MSKLQIAALIALVILVIGVFAPGMELLKMTVLALVVVCLGALLP
jgi:hypothetical protein